MLRRRAIAFEAAAPRSAPPQHQKPELTQSVRQAAAGERIVRRSPRTEALNFF
jgi:hypothetical protein